MAFSTRSFLLLFSFFLCFSTLSQAQFARFGLRAGPLFSDWVGEKRVDSTINYDGKVGAFLGFYSVNDLSSHWCLEYGLNLSWKGFKVNGQLIIPGVQIGASIVNQSIYIDVPIAIRYVFGDNSPDGLFVKAGTQFSYLVYNKIDGQINYNGTNYYGDPDSNADELNRFDIALFPGIGYQFTNGVHFQLIYEYGLLNIVKDEEYLGIKSAQNSVFKIQFGIDL